MAVIGRFQPFHWGHFEYIVEAARQAESLAIGVTNPTREKTRHTTADPARSRDEANPFSYEQRAMMISTSLARMAPNLAFTIVPCDLRTPESLRISLGPCDIVALTIYDNWGLEKLALAESAGYAVQILWRRVEKITSGTDIRDRWRTSRPWTHLVPSGTAEVLESIEPSPHCDS
ncbi:MAG: adenylyltransferase/cytidyltransferase family protein [Actinoallomurus sp.]